jgi:hypothetical protein
MNDPLPLPGHDRDHDHEHDTARCPIPEWALWPLAILLPLLALAALIWAFMR